MVDDAKTITSNAERIYIYIYKISRRRRFQMDIVSNGQESSMH